MIKGTREERLALRQNEKYIVDTILPAGELHLIGGASGAGKTTWLLQWLRQWSEGKPVFGFKSHPCPYVYITFDRALGSTDRTMRRLRMDDWDLPAYAIEDILKTDYSIDRIVNRFPEAELYIIEGFQGLLPDTSKGRGQNKSEMLWVIELRRKVLSKGKTVIGITHNPKMKLGESYESARSNFLGSNSLIGCTSTLVSFEMPKNGTAKGQEAHTPTDEREVVIRGRDFPDIHQMWTRDAHGGFIESTQEVLEQNSMDVWLALQPFEVELTTKQINDIGANCEPPQSRDQVKRWIARKLNEGAIRRKREAVYERLMVQ